MTKTHLSLIPGKLYMVKKNALYFFGDSKGVNDHINMIKGHPYLLTKIEPTHFADKDVHTYYFLIGVREFYRTLSDTNIPYFFEELVE